MLNLIVNFILLSTFYQLLIQFWQPLTQKILEMEKIGSDTKTYGLLFLAILAGQSFAGFVVEKIKNTENAINISILFGLFSLFLLGVAIFYNSYFIIISVVFLFFSNRVSCISMQSIILAETIPDLRATMIAASSTLTRLLLVAVIPAFSFLVTIVGWQAIFYLCAIIFIIIFPKNTLSFLKMIFD